MSAYVGVSASIGVGIIESLKLLSLVHDIQRLLLWYKESYTVP